MIPTNIQPSYNCMLFPLSCPALFNPYQRTPHFIQSLTFLKICQPEIAKSRSSRMTANVPVKSNHSPLICLQSEPREKSSMTREMRGLHRPLKNNLRRISDVPSMLAGRNTVLESPFVRISGNNMRDGTKRPRIMNLDLLYWHFLLKNRGKGKARKTMGEMEGRQQ